MKKWVLILFSLIVSYGGFFWVLPKKAFWIRDEGNKFILSQSLFNAPGGVSGALIYPGKIWDKDCEFVPIRPPFAYIRNDALYSQYPPYFSVLGKYFFHYFSYSGLLLLSFFPGIGIGVLLLYFFSRLFKMKITLVMMLLVFFGTPLLFYYFVYWEHALSVFLMLLGMTLFFRFERTTGGVFSGMLLGASVFLREESILFFLAFVLALILQSEFRRNLASFVTGFIIGFSVVVFLDCQFGVDPFRHLFQQYSEDFSFSLKTFFRERWNVFLNLFFSCHAKPFYTAINWLVMVALFFKCIKNFRLLKISNCLLLSCLAVYPFMLSFKGPVQQLLSANGLVFTFPAILLFLFGDTSTIRKSPLVSFLLNQSFLFVLLVCLFCPVVSSLGIHWGPRMLLPVIPGLTLLCCYILDGMHSRFHSFFINRLMVPALIVINGLLQGISLYYLYAKTGLNEQIFRQLALRPEKVIITSVPWFAEEMAPLYFQKYIFYCPDQEHLLPLIKRLQQERIHEVLFINPEIPGQKDNLLALPSEFPYFHLHAQSVKI